MSEPNDGPDALPSSAESEDLGVPESSVVPVDLVEFAMLRPVRPGNAFEETVSRLLQTIRLGVIAPGGQLPPERELAALLDVSRDTVRDAIRSLSTAGYLVSKRGRYGGTFVREVVPSGPIDSELTRRPPTAAEINDVLVLREILEVGAVRAAAAMTLSAPERVELWAQLQAVTTADPADYRRLDSRFHLTVGELVGSPSLVTLLADSRTQVNTLLNQIPLFERNIRHSNEQHERIAIAILTADAESAAREMREHLEGTASLLRAFLA
ncbi:FadR/GntR family transcriptional regulator [Subtercola frigoramans]|uniref:DNA-binding FadR family transcriptional regulator n=1 Tax=Subtercola frigoramans TaxID=120298 RepID=A0ABS2L819_9MICO|nr:FCD domain-containing protein [Subtercola frigoramans]MBM7473233.1 DNA-binding FadR family transcriptional regulator [Subtercola frigoramans]